MTITKHHKMLAGIAVALIVGCVVYVEYKKKKDAEDANAGASVAPPAMDMTAQPTVNSIQASRDVITKPTRNFIANAPFYQGGNF